jgi:DNA repair exonuclease SbcCD ATPase subunit
MPNIIYPLPHLIESDALREVLKNDVQSIETGLRDGIIWSYGITKNGVESVNKNDSIFTKIWFVVKRIFRYIDTSPTTFSQLQRDIKVAEENNYNQRIHGLRARITELTQQERSLTEIQANCDSATAQLNLINQQINAANDRKREVELLVAELSSVETLTQRLEQTRAAMANLTEALPGLKAQLERDYDAFAAEIGLGRLSHHEWLTHANSMGSETMATLEEKLEILLRWQKITDVSVDLHQSFARKLSKLKHEIIQMRDVQAYANLRQEISDFDNGYTAQTNWWGIRTLTVDNFNDTEKEVLTHLRDWAQLKFNAQRLMALNVRLNNEELA